MKNLKLWPHLTVVALVFAVVSGAAVGLWVRHEQQAKAEALPGVARIERVDGAVGLNNSLADDANTEWVAVTPNTPISVGDRIYTRDNSQASIAFTGRNFARLNDGSSLDVLALSDHQTQLALRDGSALFDVGYLAPGDLFEVATPYGAVDLNQPGLYEVGIDDNGSAWISVLSGLAQVVGLAGSGEVSKGEILTLVGQAASQIALSRLDPSYAGGLVNDYYGYRYPDVYDGRYIDYNTYLNDPYYYDPSRRFESYRYASDLIPGLYDLDYYGDWQNVNGYGYVWQPQVDTGWAPYQSGYWTNDYPYGLTWVSNEPWGYAPYHYGRWLHLNDQWFWVPEQPRTQPNYAPALVAFLPMDAANGIGWVPLAPNDQYAPRYYDDNWQAHYLSGATVYPQQVVNLGVPGAVTIVGWDDFHQVVDGRRIRRGDRHTLANVRPQLDPLLDGPLRNAALRSAWGRGKMPLPPGIAKRLEDTQVVSNASLRGLRQDRDLAKRLRVESVPDVAKRTQLKFRDERNSDRGGDERRRREVPEDSVRGTGEARQQLRDGSHQRQNVERRIERARPEQRSSFERQRVRQAQGERVGHDSRAEREASRLQQRLQQEATRQQQRQLENERRQQQSRRDAVRQQEQKRRAVEFKGPPVKVQVAEKQRQRYENRPVQPPVHQVIRQRQPERQMQRHADKPSPPEPRREQSTGGAREQKIKDSGGGRGKGKGRP